MKESVEWKLVVPRTVGTSKISREADEFLTFYRLPWKLQRRTLINSRRPLAI